ncbi:NAD(+)/NADH kinase [Candidatus Bathyarchaeota archaeon]|nr:NAD(+)/NADH kinase [Candidatus Bathyarchaeota archaeon]MBS7618483.1 NAD(+)/NADH kinase [Candidatus Bathyarchaeota archaeon]
MMIRMFKRAVLISRSDSSEALKLADKLRQRLLDLGLSVEVEEDVASKLGFHGKPMDELDGDFAVVVGGDGTILRAIHGLKRDIPLLTVRLGKVGFLAEVEKEEALEVLSQLISGGFMVEECFTLTNNKSLPEALNEIMVGAELPLKTIDVEVYVDGLLIAKDRVDAIIVATTTGATGYSLSAGGCLVDSRVKAIMLVPVCPLSTNFKPYVLPEDSEIRISVAAGDSIVVLVDGQLMSRFKPPFEVTIGKGRRTIKFIRFESNFYKRVKRRLALSSI